MPDLIPLGPQAWYLPGAVNSVVFGDGQGGALLVDTGLDESHARKLLRAVADAGLRPTAILNTHSHADHHGGNAFILKRFPELEAHAPPVEAAVIRHPILEPLALYGAMPPQALRGKFLLAPASPARDVQTEGQVTLGGVEVGLLPVPGHAAQMVAVRCGAVLYAADALFGPQALEKHPLTFCADSAAQKASAAALRALEGVQTVLPGHGDPAEHLAALVDANLTAYGRTTQAVLDAVQGQAGTVDDLLARVCDSLGVQMENAGAVVLNRAVVSAHLAELLAGGRVAMTVSGNKLVFSAQT